MDDLVPYVVILVSGTLGLSLLTASGIMYLKTRKHKRRGKSSWSRKSKSVWLWLKIVTYAAIKSVAVGVGFALLFLLITVWFMGGFALFAALLAGAVMMVIYFNLVFTDERQKLTSKLSRERKVSIPKNRKGAESPAPRQGKGEPGKRTREGKPKISHSRAGRASKEQPRPRTQSGSMSRKPVFQPHNEFRPSPLDASPRPPNLRTSFPIGYGPLDDSSEDDDLLPSDYSRSEYHRYGATDDDIKFWGLDQPGAPPPDAAGWVIWGMMDEMDADGDGFIDDPFDDPFF